MSGRFCTPRMRLALNAKLRRAVRARGHFPNDDAATKLLFLVLNRSEKEWIMPPREWSMAKAQFVVLFGERFTMVWPNWFNRPAAHEFLIVASWSRSTTI